MKVERVGIVGGGSAGFLAALALKRKLPQLSVTVIKSEQLPIIGVGEATTWGVPSFLHDFLELDRVDFHRRARPSWKGGVRLDWGTRDHFDYTFEGQMVFQPEDRRLPRSAAYYCQEDMRTASVIRATMDLGLSPLVPQPRGDLQLAGPIGYHIENETFVACLEEEALACGVQVIERLITSAARSADGSIAGLTLEDGRTLAFDLYVDCSGFRSRLLRQELGVPFLSFQSSLFCDRAIVCGWPRGEDEPVRPYTGSFTLRSGWVFVTEHWERINCGYVFSSAFISDEEAERELRAYTKGKAGQTRFVPYVSGRCERAWEKNVVGIGNSCGFVEPLQSTGLHVICDLSRFLVEVLAESDCRPNEHHQRHFNRLFAEEWDQIRQFLAMHYKLNDRLDTPFWRAARNDTDLAGAQEMLDVYRACGPSPLFTASLPQARGFFGWDGYLTLLVGMRAHTERPPRPSAAESTLWRALVQEKVSSAAAALPMRRAFDAVTRPGASWTFRGVLADPADEDWM